jgi:hypothetical protein
MLYFERKGVGKADNGCKAFSITGLNRISRRTGMLGAASLISILAGAALATAATRFPAHTAMLERCGGVLLVLGLAILGGALPFYR